MTVKVLFVCLGNICRSPTAQGVFAEKARQRHLAAKITIDSAGTGGWHTGVPPDRRSQQAAKARGYDLSALRARKVDEQDFYTFDYVLAMDKQNLVDLQAMSPPDSRAAVKLFLSYGKSITAQEVPDPYYGGARGFEYVLDLVEAASDGLLDDLVDTHRLVP